MRNFFGGIVLVVVPFLFCCGDLGSGQTLPDYGNYLIESFSWMNFPAGPLFFYGQSGNGVRYSNYQNQRERQDFNYANGDQVSWFTFHKNDSFYSVFTHEKEKSCYRVDFEQEMVPFGSGCEFEGEAIVENRKGSRWDCPPILTPMGNCAQIIYTENNRLQNPLRESLSFGLDDSNIYEGGLSVLLLDVSSFEQRKPPNRVFKLPQECYGIQKRSLPAAPFLFHWNLTI